MTTPTPSKRKPAPKRRVIDVEKVHEAASKTPTGPEIMELMGEEPTLDKVFDNAPDVLSDDDLWEYIDSERHRHAVFIEKDNT